MTMSVPKMPVVRRKNSLRGEVFEMLTFSVILRGVYFTSFLQLYGRSIGQHFNRADTLLPSTFGDRRCFNVKV